MKVLFLPKVSNPYQYLLAENLAPLGVEVEHLAEFPSLRWLVKHRNEVQILHIHWPNLLYIYKKGAFSAFVIKLVFARLLGYKIVWTMHNIMPHESKSPRRDFLGRMVLVAVSHSIIAHCEYAKNEARKRFFRTRNVHINPHPNYKGIYKHDISRGDARKILGIEPKKFVYLFFGQIRPYKGVEGLIETFKKLNSNDAELLIVGVCHDKVLKNELIQATQHLENIKLYPEHVPEEDVQNFFQAADVLVTPFSNVLTSGSAILGLSFGLPIIAPAIGCLPELITAKMGILYDPSKENGLYDALQAIRTQDIAQMRRNVCRVADDKNFSWKTFAQKTQEVYLQACQ